MRRTRRAPPGGPRLRLLIEGLGSEGEGVGRAQGRAVFVPFALPGERVLARVVHAGARRLVAELDEVLEPAPERVRPPCPVFGRCGGCQLQHAGYSAQLALKRRLLVETLRSVGGLEVGERDGGPRVLAAPEPLGYRNRGQYPVARQARRVVTGFFAPRSHAVVPVEACAIHDPRVDQAVRVVRAWAQRERLRVYDEERRTGWLRHVMARVGVASGQVLVVLVGRHELRCDWRALTRELGARVPGVVGLVLNLQPASSNVILGRRSLPLWGQPHVEESLFGLRFRLSVGSFFQVNTRQAEQLFGRVRAFLGEAAERGRPVVDAYSGVGVLAQVLAQANLPVVGIEVVPQAVADARASARAQGLGGLEFHEGLVEEVLPRLVARGLRPGAVVLDPPRKGCEPAVLEALARSRVPRVAYVSCHPGTLARDLAELRTLGYRLHTLEAVDMFPQTAHVETFAGLVRA
ncbi:MAG TPA: 23S rRNA (uracil(1939)-C(5))-methyltransferase RlmD [Myxococcota bacterium]|nr:23S rRNA (uracil(1939)-C(5))-methyltransferase RlmD [Myxococcota bacterium]HRY94319.1 23S rRNA (uracil(1939)-C(5))-methyltransferase RlmD [Myxococcota bacterium]HSA21553.1 23S rRNA (uracil(1939)-C(5))-methyltransferase RlmD [Myxococcota bacterium]